jgi:integrase
MTPKVIWQVVKSAAARARIERLAPHDLRRTRARLCHLAGGELSSRPDPVPAATRVDPTTERYLGCQQKLRSAVNDRLGVEPDAA